MAKHTTHKSTLTGKTRTKARRQARAAKQYSPPFDVSRLERDLHAGAVR